MHAELCAICACVSMHISKTTGWRTETYEQHSDYEAVNCQRYGGRACLQDNMHPSSRPHFRYCNAGVIVIKTDSSERVTC